MQSWSWVLLLAAHQWWVYHLRSRQLSIMRVFWGMALTPELSKLYHKNPYSPWRWGCSWLGYGCGDAECSPNMCN